MDSKDLIHMRCEQTEQALLEKIDRVLDKARDNAYLSREDVAIVKDAWKALWYAKQVRVST